jgi:RecA/RadA recombinase
MSLPPAPDGPPPPYERHVFVQPNDATGGDDLTVENFLKTVNPDLSHFSPAFEELGISSEADLVVVRSWAPAVRKDFFERELMGRMSALQIQALNVKLGET